MQKTLYLIVALAFIVYSTSCNKDNKTTTKKACGTTSDRIAMFDFNSADSFQYYTTQRRQGDLYKTTIYKSGGGLSYFAVGLSIANVCPYQDAQVTTDLTTVFHDTSIKDSVAFHEVSSSLLTVQDVPFASGSYHLNELLTFSGITDSTSLSAVNLAIIPSQGSWQADSTYFFTNLINIQVSVLYNTR